MRYSEFRWTLDDMTELLPYLDSMSRGENPFDYEDTVRGSNKKPSPIATFAVICEIAADINTRIDKCKGDGIVMKWRYCEGKSLEEISLGSGCSIDSVRRRSGNALGYISTHYSRKTTYRDFVSHPKEAQKGGVERNGYMCPLRW